MLIRRLRPNEQRLAPRTIRPVRHGLSTAIGTVLIAGLSGCSPTASDPIGHTTPDTPSRQTASATLSPQSRALDTHAHATSQPTLEPTPERLAPDAGPQPPSSRDAARPVPTEPDPSTAARQQWFTEARTQQDVAVRRQALELWAEQPSQNLDPVTYALVDEDESVRTRAQELYEQQLEREAAVVQLTVPGSAEHPMHHAE
jgi:hypothetical protein